MSDNCCVYLQVKPTRKDQQDRFGVPVARSLAHQTVVESQSAKGKKRAHGPSSAPEIGIGGSNNLSRNGTAKINILNGQQFWEGDLKLNPAVAANTTWQMAAAPELSSAADALTKAKKDNKASAMTSNSNVTSTNPSNGRIPDPLIEAGGDSSHAAAKGKQKKLGRNARLRLKRQAYRQQAQMIPDSQGHPAGGVALAKTPNQAMAGRQVDLTATRYTNSLSLPGSAAQAMPGKGKQAAALTAKLGAGAVKQKHLQASAKSPELRDLRPAGKAKKQGLLEQMRSKLSGGRFRMLNEQLYTSEGQHAFRMMQRHPELYQQYHEVCLCSACLPALCACWSPTFQDYCR